MSDLTPSARKLLADARPAFGPSAAARERMRGEVLRHAASTGSAASEAPPSGVRLSLKAHGGKLLGASLVALVATSYGVVRSSASDPVTVAPAPAVMAAPSEETSRAAEELASPHLLPEAPIAVAAVASTIAPEPSAGRRPAASPKSSAVRAGSVVGEAPPELPLPAGSLGAEMRLLRDAQSAFKSGDLALASRKVDEHARSFPDGVLREERLVLGVLLACAEGRVERARRAADEFAASHPRSSHLDALRGSCAGASASAPAATND
ncbi:MAG: hypothetical protein J0I07_23725 [Myxococcales bacterium]|nr:hypothetical protein [Myxococcales bacterium]